MEKKKKKTSLFAKINKLKSKELENKLSPATIKNIEDIVYYLNWHKYKKDLFTNIHEFHKYMYATEWFFVKHNMILTDQFQNMFLSKLKDVPATDFKIGDFVKVQRDPPVSHGAVEKGMSIDGLGKVIYVSDDTRFMIQYFNNDSNLFNIREFIERYNSNTIEKYLVNNIDEKYFNKQIFGVSIKSEMELYNNLYLKLKNRKGELKDG